MADVTTTRLVLATDHQATNINALTSLTPQSAKIPMAFDTDREAIEKMLGTLPLSNVCNAKIVRILDTLSVAEMEISESLWSENKNNVNLTAIDELRVIEFDPDGNLAARLST